MHFAAISNDPMGDIHPGITHSINRDASVGSCTSCQACGSRSIPLCRQLLGLRSRREARSRGGRSPQSVDGVCPVEDRVGGIDRRLADDGFTPAYLRNATAYGHSPMLRIDLVVNNLLASALSFGEIRIQSDGTPWRPLIHCRDIARAFVAFMDAPKPNESTIERSTWAAIPRTIRSATSRPGRAADSVCKGRLHRRGRQRSPQLPRQVRPARLRCCRTSACIHARLGHGGAPPQDGRARFRQADFEGDQFVRLDAVESTRSIGVQRLIHVSGQVPREELSVKFIETPRRRRLPDRIREAWRRPGLLRSGRSARASSPNSA